MKIFIDAKNGRKIKLLSLLSTVTTTNINKQSIFWCDRYVCETHLDVGTLTGNNFRPQLERNKNFDQTCQKSDLAGGLTTFPTFRACTSLYKHKKFFVG